MERNDDGEALDETLAALRLRRARVASDGNCFFRAIADQVFGEESRHEEIRALVAREIARGEREFAPFVDEEPYAAYAARVARNGEWAGHVEIIACARALKRGICIHQVDQPRWVAGTREVSDDVAVFHVSYEGGEHYNSVRALGGRLDEPGGPVAINALREPDLARVLARLGGAVDVARARRMMRACGNDVEACVEKLEDELEREDEARKKAVEGGVDVEEFDSGDWCEVRTKKTKGAGKRATRKSAGSFERELEALAI